MSTNEEVNIRNKKNERKVFFTVEEFARLVDRLISSCPYPFSVLVSKICLMNESKG